MIANGQITELHRAMKERQLYVEHQECYFMTNSINDTVKRPAVLLSYCVADKYSFIQKIGVPSKLTAVPYKALVNRVTAQFNPDLRRRCSSQVQLALTATW